MTDEGRQSRYWNIPIANTTSLLLGTGTSITQAAMRELAKAGVLVGFCGGGGTPLFAANEVEVEVSWLTPQSEYRPTEPEQLRLNKAGSQVHRKGERLHGDTEPDRWAINHSQTESLIQVNSCSLPTQTPSQIMDNTDWQRKKDVAMPGFVFRAVASTGWHVVERLMQVAVVMLAVSGLVSMALLCYHIIVKSQWLISPRLIEAICPWDGVLSIPLWWLFNFTGWSFLISFSLGIILFLIIFLLRKLPALQKLRQGEHKSP